MNKSIVRGKKERPKDILDIIQEDYPEKYPFMVSNCPKKNSFFTSEEWLAILAKSRKSYSDYLIKGRD